MRKNKFLSGLSTKLVLAIVALSTAMFTSCEKENISVSVTPVNATAYVNITVIAENTDVTSSATITSNTGAVIVQNNSYLVKLEGAPTIESQSITVNATYKGMAGSANVTIPALKEAETASVTAKVFLKYTNEDVEVKEEATVEKEEIANPTPEAEEKDWTNSTAQEVTKKFTYTDIEGSQVLSNDYEGYDETIRNLINSYNKDYSEAEKTIDIVIPAYTKKVPEVTSTKSVITYNIVTKTRTAGNTIVTFTVEDHTTTVKADPISIGHGEYGNNNAGGGTADAE